MQNVLHALAGGVAGVDIANIAFDEGKPTPRFWANDVAHHVQIFLVAGKEVVQTNHGLPKFQQMFQQVGANKARNAGDKPTRRLGSHGFGKIGIRAHFCVLFSDFRPAPRYTPGQQNHPSFTL